jgi:chromosome segregation ATPase
VSGAQALRVALGESLGRARVAAEKWEGRLRDEILPRASASSLVVSPDEAMASLREQAAKLDEEIERVQRRLSEILAQKQDAEQRAVRAIKNGDDRTAKWAIKEHEAHDEAVAGLEADLTVLRATLTECRRDVSEFLCVRPCAGISRSRW